MEFKKLKTYLFSIDEDYETCSNKIGIAISAFANKINGKSNWKYNELVRFREIYNMSDELFLDIFFN